jgi:hypothetical protein
MARATTTVTPTPARLLRVATDSSTLSAQKPIIGASWVVQLAATSHTPSLEGMVCPVRPTTGCSPARAAAAMVAAARTSSTRTV